MSEYAVISVGANNSYGHPTEEALNRLCDADVKVFHTHYPSCSSVKQMKDSNKSYFTGTRDEVIDMGYEPRKRCNL